MAVNFIYLTLLDIITMQADILRFFRLSKNLNQEAVVEVIGLHQSAYSA